MAINASPNPNADLIKVDKNRIARTSSVVDENSISLQQLESLNDDPDYLIISKSLGDYPITSPLMILELIISIFWYDDFVFKWRNMSEADVIKNTKGGPITSESIKKDLAAIGVKPGMVLIVHSSLSKMGWVSGGAVAVILALEEVLGPEGTLVMPTHTGDLSDPEEWSNPPVPQEWKEIIRQTLPAFDPEITPTRAMGRIAESFRSQRNVLRSNHPHMSFAARGKQAEVITKEHQLDFALGEKSPLARLYDLEAWILLLGVKHDNNTSLHLAENRADYPGKKEIKQGAPLMIDGERKWVVLNELEEHSEEFKKIGKAYKKSGGKQQIGKIGNARSKLIPQRNLVDFAVGWMEENRDYRKETQEKQGAE